MPNIKGRYRAGVPEHFDLNSQETTFRSAPIKFEDDFLGADIVIPAGGSDESGCKWAKAIVGAAPPLVAGIANEANGAIACTLTSDAQAQTAALYMDDQVLFDPGQGLIIEMRVKVKVVPTLVAELCWGIMAATGVPDTVATSAFFTADGSGLIVCESDNGTTDTSLTSGITATTAQWKVYMIDCTNEDDVKFYIDGVSVATASTFKTAAACQPWLGGYKASGAGLGTLHVDYVKIWQNRS